MIRLARRGFVALLAGLLLLCACAGNNGVEVYLESTPSPTPQPPVVRSHVIPEKPPAPTETPPEGEEPADTAPLTSRLTGLPIEPEAANQRPIAVVVNNLFRAHPQSGLAKADIIYEVLAEANITRLVAIFQDHNEEKIGPIRSARDYFIDFALDYDAIFVHHGGSPSGYARLSDLNINHLDGINLEGPYFWRDRTYPAWDTLHSGQTRPMEHSSYTSSEKIKAAIAQMGYRDTLYEDAAFGFSFQAGVPLAAQDADTAAHVVKVPFSGEYTRTFTYDPAAMTYTVSNKNGPHMDANTQTPVTVTNILIQLTSMRVIPGDAEGRREVQTVGQGQGYWVSAGTYTPITWQKDSHTEPTRWYAADGTDLRLHVGKTWICVFQDNETPVFEAAGDGGN